MVIAPSGPVGGATAHQVILTGKLVQSGQEIGFPHHGSAQSQPVRSVGVTGQAMQQSFVMFLGKIVQGIPGIG